MMSKSLHKKHKLRVGYLNIYHLANKVPDLCVYLNKPEPFHLFGVSETRLGSHIIDEAVSVANYSVFRRDPSVPGQTGIAAYVHTSICPLIRRRADLETQEVECLWLEYSRGCNSRPLYIGFVYRNPAAAFDWYDDFLHNIDSVGLPRNDVLLLGDFNIDLLKPHRAWECTTNLVGLKQLVTSPTRVTSSTTTLIDHIYTNRKNNVTDVAVTDFSVSDHFPVVCSWLLKLPPKTKKGHTTILYRSFKHFDKDAFLYDLHNTPFCNVLNETDPEEALGLWYKLFIGVLNKHAPLRSKRVKTQRIPPLG